MLLDRKCTLPCLHRYWPPKVLIPRRILDLISSFLSLLEQPPSCISVLGGGDKLGNCLASTLPGNRKPKVVKTYGPADFEKSLEKPTTQVIERHDFRSILDYLLMKLRTALDRDWLHSLPALHKVGIFLRAFVLVSILKIIPIFRFSVSSHSTTRSMRRPSLLNSFLRTGTMCCSISIRFRDCQFIAST